VDHAITAIETETFVLQVLSTVPGCFDRDTVVVNVHPRPFLDAGPNSYTIPVRSTTVIGGAPTSLTGGPSHTWSPAEYLNDPMAMNPITNNTVNVTFTVSIEYGEGCIESDTVQVLILPELRIVTGFSPNGDGKNDTWVLDYIDQFPNNTVEVYNRWGDQVFFSKGYFEPFDGNYKGQKLPVGTYYYVIHLNHDSYTKPYTGPLTIFR
jgi:gliding motility-associated-like protein